MSKGKKKVPAAGELRRSQVISTFGPGAMLDLPDHSVIVGGLEYWRHPGERIYEERLEKWLGEKLARPDVKFFGPPIETGEKSTIGAGIGVFPFPNWYLGQVERTWKTLDGRVYRTRPLIPRERLIKGKYLDDDRKLWPVVPVRFVRACPKGHLGDIDWYAFVRRSFNAEHKGLLWLDEGGAGNDFAEIYVRDPKNGHKRRPLSDATIKNAPVLGKCDGRSPWLGPRVWEKCGENNRLLTRSASNAYFTQTMGVISLPPGNSDLREAVDKVWEDYLQYCEDERDVRRERRKDKVKAALDGFDDATVWDEVQRRLGGGDDDGPEGLKGIKEAEIETLLEQKPSVGEDKPNGDFYARTHELGEVPLEAEGKINRLVLLHRLREVRVQIGFTRFESNFPGVDDELDLGVTIAPVARDLTWLPACEHRGEGVFLSFSPQAIYAWLDRTAVKARGQELIAGFEAWKKRRDSDMNFPGLPYIMLHSLSHVLITAVALDCGYSASAISERIYAGSGGYGILLYTGSSGAEGTLGGLVEVGKRIGTHLAQALEMARLCSNDPVCAGHEPDDMYAERFLHGAACHGCLLIAETSCERRNEFLDRALVVPTVATPGAAFFRS